VSRAIAKITMGRGGFAPYLRCPEETRVGSRARSFPPDVPVFRWWKMQYAADLADRLVDVRDVVESFRSSHLTLPDWDQTLRRVITALSRLS
jgi:hypothetical protein